MKQREWKRKKRGLALVWMAALLTVFLSAETQMTVKATPTDVIEQTVITAPGEIDGLENQEKGFITHNVASEIGAVSPGENSYHQITVNERTILIFDAFESVRYSSWSNIINLYANASLTKLVGGWHQKIGSNNRRYVFYVDPGTYYVQCYYKNCDQTVYSYSLPVSKVMSVNYTVAADKRTATVSVTSPISSYKVDWGPDAVAVGDTGNNKFFPNTSMTDSFEVEDNGVYTVRVSSTLNEWKDYPVSLSITVSGVVKCDHDFSAYDVSASGHIAKCSKCGKQQTSKVLAHKMDGGIVTKEATTLQTGIRTYTCTECGYTMKTETIEKKKSHDYNTVLSHSATKAKYRVIATGMQGTPAVEYSKPLSKNITSVKIPKTVKIEGVTYQVTQVGANAFKNCKKLKSVTIGANVRSIGNQAFYGCKKLKSITISTKNLYSVGNNAVKGIAKKAVIKVPKSKRYSYTKLFSVKTGFKKTMKIK